MSDTGYSFSETQYGFPSSHYQFPVTHDFSSGVDSILITEETPPLNLDRTFFLEKSITNGIYTLYSFDKNTRELTYLKRYDNPQDAIDALSEHSAIGTSEQLSHAVYRSTCYHLDEKTDLITFLLDILTIFRYHNTKEFDHLVATLKILEDPSLLDTRDFPYGRFRKPAFNKKTSITEFYLRANPVARLYANLYDLVVLEYDNFSDEKYQDRKPEDFHEFIKSVLKIFNIFSE